VSLTKFFTCLRPIPWRTHEFDGVIKGTEAKPPEGSSSGGKPLVTVGMKLPENLGLVKPPQAGMLVLGLGLGLGLGLDTAGFVNIPTQKMNSCAYLIANDVSKFTPHFFNFRRILSSGKGNRCLP